MFYRDIGWIILVTKIPNSFLCKLEIFLYMQAFIDLQRKMRYNVLEVITMEKTMTLNLRVNPTVKQQAEDVLKQLGIPMATAIDMYLRQNYHDRRYSFSAVPA